MVILADTSKIRLGLPKGRMKDGVLSLLSDAGIRVRSTGRGYRPTINMPDFEVKILKPQNIVEMLQSGSRDVGFAGADWVEELDVDLVELLDTGLDPVQVVAAAPESLVVNGQLPKRQLTIASEYERLTQRWIARRELDAEFVRSYGATEVFPPEDADCIVDNTATGATLIANGLAIVDELITSSTRFYANPRALDDPRRREVIERFTMLMESVLEARKRVMLEVNVDADKLEVVMEVLPCMREATVSPLRGDAGFALKAAVTREILPTLIPEIKSRGGTDIVVTNLAQIVA